jgi:nicotinamidase-related amidase
MVLEGAMEAAENAAQLLSAFRTAELEIIHVQHVSLRPDAPLFLPNTTGVEIHRLVAPLAGEALFVKAFPNSFRATGLLEHLQRRQIAELTVAGMMSQRCIDSTVRAAFDLGFNIELAHDACATRALSFNGMVVPASHVHTAFMAALSARFANVVSTKEVCLGLHPSNRIAIAITQSADPIGCEAEALPNR